MAKKSSIKKKYYLFDCTRENLGRIAVGIAKVLQGKHSCSYEPNVDGGDFAVVINASRMNFSGRKKELKLYHTFSGYPGGIRTEKLSELLEKNPERVVREAVYNMLPKNKLRDCMIKRLLVFKEANHGMKIKLEKI